MSQASKLITNMEGVYYPGPVPTDLSVLTTLCFVFDKIYFPAVDLPLGGFDKDALQKEIARLRALNNNSYETQRLISILSFLDWRYTLDGILEYPSPEASFGVANSEEIARVARKIYDVHYPPRENFQPAFETASTKGLPGGEASVSFAGDFFYQAQAISFSAEKNIPLIDDGSTWQLPFRARYKDLVAPLTAVLCLESVRAAMPLLPILGPREIVEFRMENKKELQSFRAAMLRLAAELNKQISDGISAAEFAKKAKVVVDTEIVPSLHELNNDLQNPNRAWHKRLVDGVGIMSSVFIANVTGGLLGTTLADGLQKALGSEVAAKADKNSRLSQNGLYYLIKAQALRK